MVVAARLPTAPISREGSLEPGDVIHAINARRIKDLGDLRSAVGDLKIGEAAVVQVERAGLLMYLGFRIE